MRDCYKFYYKNKNKECFACDDKHECEKITESEFHRIRIKEINCFGEFESTKSRGNFCRKYNPAGLLWNCPKSEKCKQESEVKMNSTNPKPKDYYQGASYFLDSDGKLVNKEYPLYLWISAFVVLVLGVITGFASLDASLKAFLLIVEGFILGLLKSKLPRFPQWFIDIISGGLTWFYRNHKEKKKPRDNAEETKKINPCFWYFLILGLFLVGCANSHAQDTADMFYKYSPQYIFDNPQLSLTEKNASWIGAALGQQEIEITGDEIVEVWQVYQAMKRKKEKGSPVEKWQALKKANKLIEYLKE